jgi:glyceraldehyde 3-phosphate dehydrogenase
VLGEIQNRRQLTPYFGRGVKKVIVAAPVKEEALNVVMGVNDHLYEPQKHHLLTAASCTTNCLAPWSRSFTKASAFVTARSRPFTTSQYANGHRRAAQRPAPSASEQPLADPHDHRVRHGHRLDLSRLKGKLNGLAVRVPLLMRR